jgi:hypothetical protein
MILLKKGLSRTKPERQSQVDGFRSRSVPRYGQWRQPDPQHVPRFNR